MIVIELENRKYKKTIDALEKMEEYLECIKECLKEHEEPEYNEEMYRGSKGRMLGFSSEYKPMYPEQRRGRGEYDGGYSSRYM